MHLSHVLIIEDEILLALSVEDALRELGYASFTVATTQQQAVAASEQRCPDLIVADHRIIDGTGTEAVLAICSDKVIPVVFVTSSEPEVREHLPDAFIVPKPFTLPHLERAVKAAIDRPFTLAADGNTPGPTPPGEA